MQKQRAADEIHSDWQNRVGSWLSGNNTAKRNKDKVADRGRKNISDSAGATVMQIRLSGKKIYMAAEAVDFRKAIDGLCGLLPRQLEAGDIYIFYNKGKNKLKILGWHGNGFALLYKRLEKGKFTIAGDILTEEQLSWLLAGLDWEEMTSWGELKYKDFY